MADTFQSLSSLTTDATKAMTPTYAKDGDNSTLDSEAFLKLFLTELQYQDPTEPMDNAKMLEQTSQLATLQSQEVQQDALLGITKTLTDNAQYQAQFSMVSAIGKTATTDLNAFSTDGKMTNLTGEIYFSNPIKSGNINILDENTQEVIKTIPLAEELAGKSGYLQFSWDGTDNSGNMAKAGKYLVQTEYLDTEDNMIKNYMGVGKIDAIKYENGEPFLSMGTMKVPMINIKEIS